MTVIYPDNQHQAQYIVNVSSVYLAQYQSYEKQIEAFSAEIIVKIANIIDAAQDKDTTIRHLQSLLDGNSESDQSELGSMFSQASLNNDEEVAEIVTRISELELFLKGHKEIITMNLINKDIPLRPGQESQVLQQIVAAMTIKCIKEICEANLSPQQIQRPSPVPAPFPQGAAPQQSYIRSL